MNSVDTLVDLLRRHAAAFPDRRLYTFLPDGESESGSLTYSQLDAAARETAAALLEWAEPGDRAMLLYPVGLDYVVGFFGCLYAGIVAVPAYPLKTDKQSGARIQSMIEDCRPRLVLTCEKLRADAEAAIGDLSCDPAPLVVATDGTPARSGGAAIEPVISLDALALLQYTSASVADAKGVRITHANIMANQRMIHEAMSHDEGSHFVSWLPPYHDMGLVGNLLQPLYLGASCVFMPPVAFIQKPVRWLAAISKYGARTSGAPTFAYDLCVKKIEPELHPDLDLSRWTVAYCGAEAVDARVFERFCARFAACGFNRDAFYPCYGLAEVTLMASGIGAREAPSIIEVDGDLLERGRLREQAGGDRRLVGCGAAPSGSEIRIVDPDTSEALDDGEVGEIWVAGAHVADGYWGRPDASQELFQARVAGGSTGYLRTGDLGAVLRGQLYVVGRIKEIIIHRGRNLCPVDIESVVMSSLSEGVNACAAFALPGENTEEVGIVVEVARRGFDVAAVDRLGEAIAWEIYRAFEVFPARLAFARPGAIPKTSSGKKRRLLCASLLMQGKLDILAESRHAASAGERGEDGEGESAWLAGLIHRFTGLPIDHIANGPGGARTWSLESLRAVEIIHQIERRRGVLLPVSVLYEAPSLDAVVREIERRSADRESELAVGRPHPANEVAAAIDVTPNQEAVWFSQQIDPSSAAFHLAWAMRFAQPLDADRLRESVRTVLARHEVLRWLFQLSGDGRLVASALPAGVVDYEHSIGLDDEIEGWIYRECERPFRLEQDLLVRVRHGRGHGGDVVAFVLHHLIADLWSCALFTDEVMEQYVTGTLVERPRSYRQFASYVREVASKGDAPIRYWRERLGDLPAIDPVDALIRSRRRLPVPGYAGAGVQMRLDRDSSRGVLDCARAYGVSRQTVLLSLYGLWLWSLTGLEDFLTGCLASGRTRSTFSRMQGLLANPFALRFRIGADTTLAEVIASVREQVLCGLEHEAYPFHAVVGDLAPTRELTRTPLFQNMFVYQQLPSSSPLAGCVIAGDESRFTHRGLEIQCAPLPTRWSRYDFTMYAMERCDELAFEAVYRPSLFERAQVSEMLSRFEALVRRAVQIPPDSQVEEVVSERQATF